MVVIISDFLKRGFFLVMVWSSQADRDSVNPEILNRLDDESKERLSLQALIPTIQTWKDLVALLQDVDFLIASRLHSTIFGFLTRIPTIAVSFDPKVDQVMEDFDQGAYLLQIHSFTANEVFDTLERLARQRKIYGAEVTSILQKSL